jgi:hypothetical protein
LRESLYLDKLEKEITRKGINTKGENPSAPNQKNKTLP